MALDIPAILFELGITDIKELGEEVFARCPGHLQRTGHEDRHPSWSMNTKTYVHYCFSCGYSGTLQMLYQDLAGEVPDDLEWELTRTSVLAAAEEQGESERQAPVVSEWWLSRFGDVPGRLLDRRHLTREAIDHFGVRFDEAKKCWVIPVRSPDGVLMGVQYRQKGVVLNDPPGMEKSQTLFGLHLNSGCSTITLVESPLDVVRFHQVDVPAVASFGAAISDTQITLLTRYYRAVVLALDDDSAGRPVSQRMSFLLRKAGCVAWKFRYPKDPASRVAVKDPGDINYDAQLRKAWEDSLSLA